MKRVLLFGAVLTQLLLSAGCYIVATPHEAVVVPPPPPPIVLHAPPRLVLIPEIGIYYAPDIEVELYVSGRAWFYFYNGYWYKGRDHHGPWVYVPAHKLPRGFAKIPPGLRKVPPGQMKKEEKGREEKGKRGREFKY